MTQHKNRLAESVLLTATALVVMVMGATSICFMAGCHRATAESLTEPPTRREAPPSAIPPWQLDRTSDNVRVYIDMSDSVRGFATAPEKLYYRLLEQLKPILADAGTTTLR